jgi:AraC family transcriptional regulator of adaptative response/methylated-DNA-[protein]-cysteine methyltransferase
VFFYGVITTGIFCLPSCSSKHAKFENIRFFPQAKSAMIAGFRSCKGCHPIEGSAQVKMLIEVARYIEAHAQEKLTLSRLAKITTLSPTSLQKSFKKVFYISPKAYQYAIRLRQFKQALKQGDGITEAIYAAGFGSISRVYGEPSRNIGMAPKVYRSGVEGEEIHYACRNTAIGLMMMAATNTGVCFVQFGEAKNMLFAQLKNEFPNAHFTLSASLDTPELDSWMVALDSHISQAAPRPDLPLDMRGTTFQIKVWKFLLRIKEGDVLSYGEVAEKIGNDKAARAVGSACGKNNIAILIPCHRVLRSDGGLGGYRWGLDRKRALLDKERSRR